MEPNNKKSKMSSNNKYKHNKKKYFQSKKQVLQAGQRGFLATCNINEKACVRECYNLLNHYADILYGPEGPPQPAKKPAEPAATSEAATEKKVDDGGSDSDDLEAAVAKCREVRKVRFQNVDTGTTNCVFIRTLLDDPVTLGKHIVDDIATTRKSMSRFVLRLVPIEAVCRANVQDIVNAAGALFDKHFIKEPTTYGIIFNRRYNQQVKREDVIAQLADLVHSKNLENKVDLQHAKKSIIVEVLRGWCLLSVIDNYLECRKFNLAELANPTEKPEKSNEDDAKSEKSNGESNSTEAVTKQPEQLDNSAETKSETVAADNE